jgi:SAM-dependent methyltransferase
MKDSPDEPVTIDCYDYPQYWDLAFRDETQGEADFIEAAANKYCDFPVTRLLEPGCGGGRLVLEMARRGYDISGFDLSHAATQYLRSRLEEHGLTANVFNADMTDYTHQPLVDIAFNTVNTFRHLLTEKAARQHLESIASSLRNGGLYILGFHLLPPDADEEDSESWDTIEGDTTVNMSLVVESCDRRTRLETIRFNLKAVTSSDVIEIETVYTLRIYQAFQLQQLVESVPEFEHVDTFDFWYDIDDPLELNDDLGDTVVVLRKL